MFLRKRILSNLVELLDERVRQMPTRPAYKFPLAGGGWGTMTWQQVGTRVRSLAAYLIDQGIQVGDRVAIMSTTRIEWPLACLAIISAGATAVPIYPDNGAEETRHILEDAGISMVFTDTLERIQVIRESGQIGHDVPIIVFDAASSDAVTLYVDASGSEVSLRAAAERQRLIRSDALATILYTSGTTGRSKGVMLTHGNWLAESMAIVETHIVDEHDVEYYWLPFAHSFGMALLFGHVAVGFLKFINGDPKKVSDNIKLVRPTFLAGPPRTFEKIVGGVKAKMEDEPWVVRTLYGFASSRAKSRYQASLRAGKKFRSAKFGISAFVFDKLADEFGGRLRFLLSGGAALSPAIIAQTDQWGLPIIVGYGLTETCGASVVGRVGDNPIGSSGWPLPGTEVRIAEPTDGRVDGEILLRGPHIMVGYYGNPEATAEVIDTEGWFHTGDLGRIEMTRDGRAIVYVTGRLKQACKLSTGKYVSPERLEVELTATGLIAHAVVVAEGRNFISALVSLDPDNLRQWANGHGLTGDYVQLATSPEVTEEVERLVATINSQFNKWERIGQIRIIPEVFTVENGYLTPSNKVVRHRIFTAFAPLVNQIYV